MIGDTDLNVAKLYNMLPAEEPGTSDGRTAATKRALVTLAEGNEIALFES